VIKLLPYHHINELIKETVSEAKQREASSFDERAGISKDALVLFGAGNLGRKTLAGLRQRGIEPLAFTDNNQELWNTKIDGITVYSPKQAAERYGNTAAFVITIWRAGEGYRMTNFISQLEQLGCNTVIPFTVLFWKYPDLFLPHFIIDLPHKTLDHKDDTLKAYNLWADAFSRKEYMAQIAWLLYADWQSLSDPVIGNQYFLDNIIYRDDEIFIDCGAFDGDTIKTYLQRRGNIFSNIIAFEPDPQNYIKLENYVSTLEQELFKKIEIYPYAVSKSCEKLFFNSTGDPGASICESGTTSVKSICLDDFLQHIHPTFIKMDIEGSEKEALVGACNIIAKEHPVLAICTYHKRHDLWNIPLLINSYFEGYSFFLRPHANECWDTVCYAIPKERLL
jgi:FkbM family methyltransferase